MNSRQRRTLEAIFEKPTRSDIRWADVEAMLRAAGANIEEDRGSRVCVALKGRRAVFHRPHPAPTVKKGALDAVRDFLVSVEVKP